MAEPSDAGGKPLEGNPLACELHPVGNDMIRAELDEQQIIDLADVVRIARQRNPAKWTDCAREQWPQEGLCKDWDIKGVLYPAGPRLRADQISIVEHDGASLL